MIRLQNEILVEIVPPDEEFDIEVDVDGVSLVNGHSGNVWLTATDVGADPAGAAAAALAAAKAYADLLYAGGSGTGFALAPYIHVQSSPASEWLVVHNRGYYPSITVLDSAGQEVQGTVEHINVNQSRIKAGAPFSGTATVI